MDEHPGITKSDQSKSGNFQTEKLNNIDCSSLAWKT
jgi:hypothetical protein